MKKENKQEELQSRREFFKSAAKAALPVIGAVVLSSLPVVSQATEMGCQYDCLNSCTGSCYGQCQTSCKFHCQGTCSRGCGGSAYGSPD